MGAEYVAIGPDELMAPLRPLISLRESQGLKTAVVPVQAIYDQFGGGYPEPDAIQAFMRYAAQHWKPSPRFLLLVGDASYDPRGYIAPAQANQLPTFLVQTVYGGETASDVGFVQLNDDPWPDIAIGRVPARTPDQVESFVAKTIAYEGGAPANPAKLSVVAIADGQEPSFRADAQNFLDLFSENYSRELYAPEAGVVNANQKVEGYLEGDELLIAYFGHGSVDMWGKDQLLTVQDVTQLKTAARLPIIINMTCLTGFFTHPKIESLAEAFLWKKEAGGVAILAPSSLTLPGDQSYLSRALVEALLAHPKASLGEIHLIARRNIPVGDRGALDVMETYMLFGDPALRVNR
jgi:hypothetical protein